MITNVEKAIREYLPGVIHMSLATFDGNKPWVCEVHYAYDDDLKLYFLSLPSRRHSKEIASNPNVAGNIVAQHKTGQKPRGVYFEGRAWLLNDVDENHAAYKKYHGRFGTDKSILDEIKTKDGGRFYQVTVSMYYLFDAVESKPAQKYELDWHKGL